MCLTQFNGMWNYVFGCRFKHGRYSRAWSLLLCYWCCCTQTQIKKQKFKQGRWDPSSGKASEKRVNQQWNTQISRRHLELSNVDFVSSDVNLPTKELCCAIVKTTKLWSRWSSNAKVPHRHVSRTHKVAFDWFFDRIDLDPKIQIRCVESRNQLADMLTEGHFTRDEWNHLLYLFKISLFSSQSCSEAMAKRPQEGDCEERVAAKSKPVRNLVSRSRAGISTVPSTASASLGNFEPKGHEVRFEAHTSFKIRKRTSLKVIQWRIPNWGIQMQIRWPARGHAWHGIRSR